MIHPLEENTATSTATDSCVGVDAPGVVFEPPRLVQYYYYYYYYNHDDDDDDDYHQTQQPWHNMPIGGQHITINK